MSVKSFKFVSPGVFINEIDNSFRPRRPDAIGPVVVGRSTKGPAMQPIKVESYSEFVNVFGDTVPGNAGGDVYRDGNFQTPMYGTYSAKAFLNANVAPLTYVRLLGQQDTNATTAGQAGWQTEKNPALTLAENGGAFGLWLFESASMGNLQTGSLGAIWYVDASASILLTGSMPEGSTPTGSIGTFIKPNNSNNFMIEITNSAGTSEKIEFNFTAGGDRFVRNVFNTSPQLGNEGASSFYASGTVNYWLGETFEQEINDAGLTGANVFGIILPIAQSNAISTGPHKNKVELQEAKTGWIIGQDLGASGDYNAFAAQKLFRLIGRKHGEWMNKNVKVSIENVKPSTTNTSEYGSFSVVLRSLKDTDSRISVIERFDNLTLDPTSENFVARVIGDQFSSWDNTEKRLRIYGDYANNSNYFYVDMEEQGYDGTLNASLLPFGYHGPNAYTTVTNVKDGSAAGATDFVVTGAVFGSPTRILFDGLKHRTASFSFPTVRLRQTSSDGGLFDQKNAYFGMQTTKTAAGTTPDMSVADPHRRWPGATTPAYYFSLDDLVVQNDTSVARYVSGSRRLGTSRTATSGSDFLLETDRYNRFTVPVWGGFDGVDIYKPDPFYNVGLGGGVTELTSYTYNTYKRAIETVADPDFIDMNLLSIPGLTNTGLTTMMVDTCEDRADAMALIDLPSVYLPAAEGLYSRSARVVGNVQTSATAIRSRQIDSSYGATFFPWVQTLDAPTGQLLWIPPSVAMLGVLGSSEKSSQVWFAPAGFNRGGLSDGAAGIPVTNVTQRLTSRERDTLYEARINPIASFPSSGIVVFGQKTLQERPSALDRINVRRLVIYLKKQISILSTQILFEQNVQATWNRFKGLVEPFLANVKVQFGISDYRLILDDTTTTPDLVDQNIMYAKIMVKPARAIEYIAIDFVVASTGASFDD